MDEVWGIHVSGVLAVLTEDSVLAVVVPLLAIEAPGYSILSTAAAAEGVIEVAQRNGYIRSHESILRLTEAGSVLVLCSHSKVLLHGVREWEGLVLGEAVPSICRGEVFEKVIAELAPRVRVP